MGRLIKELDPNPGWAIVSMVASGKAGGSPPEDHSRRGVAYLLSAPRSAAE